MVTFRFDYSAFDEHVLCAPWMVEHMKARAERGKEFAESIAPFDPDDPDGMHYRDAFEADAYIHTYKNGKRRASGVLRNTDRAALPVEFGNAHTPEHGVLRKALDVMGQ